MAQSATLLAFCCLIKRKQPDKHYKRQDGELAPTLLMVQLRE